MKLISHEEAIQRALKNPKFNIAYKKICYHVDISIVVYRARKNQNYKDEEKWGDTWKERGLVWEGKSQEERAYQWMHDKFVNWSLNKDHSFPWLKMAGEAMIGFIREKYLKDSE